MNTNNICWTLSHLSGVVWLDSMFHTIANLPGFATGHLVNGAPVVYLC